MLILARHGTTDRNSESGEPERFRSWDPVPLDKGGKQLASQLGEILSRLPAQDLYTSDIKRGMQTAQAVSKATGLKPIPTQNLRTWNVGDLTGEPVNKANLKVLHDHIDNPNQEIPGGEAYSDYLHRVLPFLDPMVNDDKMHIAVSHNNTAVLAHSLDQQDMDLLKEKGPIPPGGFMVIGPKWQVLYKYSSNQVNEEKKDAAGPTS